MKRRIMLVGVGIVAALLTTAAPASAAAEWMEITRGQITDTDYAFDDVNRVAWSQASRAAHVICTGHNQIGGFFNGDQNGTRKGAVCVGGDDAQWFDVTRGQLTDTDYAFDDVNRVGWAQARRAAHAICTAKGLVGGFFTGHQDGNRKGVVCVSAGGAESFDVTRGQLTDTDYAFDDVNRIGWAHAGRAAHALCTGKSYVGGFFTGNQDGTRKGLVCVR